MRETKNFLYEQVARIGKAVASPKRLELVELLCQGEKTVEMLAEQAEISVKLASAHLKELRLTRLVDTRKDGKYVLYRLASTSVADLWVHLRSEAEERLVELQVALANLVAHGDELEGLDSRAILKRAAAGEVLVLDVRPADEYAAAHLPHARSLPVDELKRRLAELPKDTPVVAYCRGPFCLMAKAAVELLRNKGYRAFHLTDGVAEWRARPARRGLRRGGSGMKTLLILNDAPYGSERTYNGARLAGALARQDGDEVRVFLIGDAATAAHRQQRVPAGFYNLEVMWGSLVKRSGVIGVCATCMDARGLADCDLIPGAHRSNMDELTQWTTWADKVLVF